MIAKRPSGVLEHNATIEVSTSLEAHLLDLWHLHTLNPAIVAK